MQGCHPKRTKYGAPPIDSRKAQLQAWILVSHYWHIKVWEHLQEIPSSTGRYDLAWFPFAMVSAVVSSIGWLQQ